MMWLRALFFAVAVSRVAPTFSPATMPSHRALSGPDLISAAADPLPLQPLNRLRCQLEGLTAGTSMCGVQGANFSSGQLIQFMGPRFQDLSASAGTLVRNLSSRIGCRRPRCELRRSRECSLARAVWPQVQMPMAAVEAPIQAAATRAARNNARSERSTEPECSSRRWLFRCYSPANRISSSSDSPFALQMNGAYERAASLLLMWKALGSVLSRSANPSCAAPHIPYVQAVSSSLEGRVNLQWIELLCTSLHLASNGPLNRSTAGSSTTLMTSLVTATIATAHRLEGRAEAAVQAAERALENTESENEADEFELTQQQQKQQQQNLLQKREEEKPSSGINRQSNACRNVRRTVRAAVRITLDYLEEFELPLIGAFERAVAKGIEAPPTYIRAYKQG